MSFQGQVTARPYKWPYDNSLSPATTALVVIDMQNDFCSEEGYLAQQGYSIAPTRAVIPQIARLLAAFRAKGFPVFHTREGHPPDLSTLGARERFRSRNNASGRGIGDAGPLGRLLVRGERGHAIVDALVPRAGEHVVDKPGKSAFAQTDFALLLGVAGVRNLVLCGVTTDVCVHSTMREAADRGLDCALVEDAAAASMESLHKAAVEMVTTEGGIFGAVTTVADVVAALEAWTDADNA